MIPTIVAVILWKWLLNDVLRAGEPSPHRRAGLVRVPLASLGKDYIMSSLVLTSVWQFFPFVVVTFLARLQTIPPELYEAAKVDGAGAWRRLLHVTLPADAQRPVRDHPAALDLHVHQVRHRVADGRGKAE